MKTTFRCSLLLLMLVMATTIRAADIPINITKLVGLTAQAGNPTVVYSTDAANASVDLYFTLKSGYEAPYLADGTTIISTQSRPSVSNYGYLWTNTSGSTYKLTIYNSSVYWTTSYYLGISIELELSGGIDITYDNAGSGSVDGPATALAGSTVNFTAEPASGYEISSIAVYKEDLETTVSHSGSGTDYSFTMPDEEVYVYVVFTAVAANNITFHVPTCVDTPTGGNVSSLPTPTPRVDGYQFVGWTENSSFSDASSQPSDLLTAGTAVSGTKNYYAVYKKVSSGFTMVKNTAITEGDYVISSSYAAHSSATVMTWEVDAKGRMKTNSDELTFTEEGLTCTDEQFIWHISGSAGNWTLYNNYSDYYLSAESGDASSTNGYKMVTSMSTGPYTVWTIEQGSGVYTMKNNQRESISSTPYWLGKNGNYIGFYSSKSSFYFFKRTAVSNAFTINPRCNATEYTVTINNPAVGGTATASGTGSASWTPYVLSNLFGSETVTLTATPATGYNFTSWTATRKSGTAVTVTNNSFTMPTEDVTVVPTFTPQIYTITYKDGGNTTYSGSNSASLPTSHTYGTLTNLVDGVKADWTFAGWFTDQACTAGNLVNSLGTDHVGNITLYAKWIRLYNYQAWCDKQVEYYVNGSLEFAATANASNSYNVPTYLPQSGCDDDKVFIGWSATQVNSLQQTEPTILTADGALTGVSENTILYAVFASQNGGKQLNTQSNIINETWNNRALWDGTNKMVIGNYSAWTVDNNITANPFTSFTISSTDYFGARIDVKNYAHSFISERKFTDLHSLVVTAHSITGWASQVEVYISADKSSWTKVGDTKTLNSNKSATTLTFALAEVGDYYVKINFPKTTLTSSANYYIGITGITPKQADKTYYLTDYSTNCTRATAPLAITWVDAQSGSLAEGTQPTSTALSSKITMPALQKDNYRFDGWKATIEGSEKPEVYTAGEVFLVNHAVTFTAQWTELFSVTDPEYGVTSYKDITVTSLPATMTVIGSHDITPVVDGLTDATHFAVTVGAGTNNGDDKDFTYTFTYTPDTYGTGSGSATHTATFRFKDAASGAVSEEVTIRGRSLPEEFAIAVKHGERWVALPSNLQATSAQPAIVPLTITVDDSNTPTEAIYAPTIAAYKGANRYTAANTTAIRFTATGSNYLQVSGTESTYNMWLSATGGTGVQDWQLKSADFNSYELTIPSNAYPTKKMGIYNDTYIGYHGSPNNAQIYLLPITNKYESRSSEVKEWGQRNVIVAPETVSDIAKAKVRIDDGTLSEFITPTPINVATIAGAKNIQLNTAIDFTANENKSLYIEWYNSSNALVATSQITIPLILASNGAMHTISSTKVAWEKREVHVLPGATLTADAGSFASSNVSIKQLEVYPGATVNVSTGTLKVTDLNLRGGWTRASGKQYNTPRVYINTAASLEKTRAHIDMDIFDLSEGKHYYPLAVPFATAVNTIDYADSYLAGFSNYGAGGQYIIKEYDGERRAQSGPDIDNNWKAVAADATLQPGKGYIITALAVKGEALIRIPLTFNNNWTKLGEQGTYSGTTKNQVSVTAYTGSAATTHQRHAGWNMLGVPFMSCYETGTDMYSSGALINGKIVLYPATNDPYRYETAVPYVSVPSHNFDEYIQGDITDTDLRPEWSFFVQVGTSGTIEFKTAKQAAESTSPLYAPRRAATPDREIRTGIILSNGDAEDKTTLIISDRYTADYEIGADLEKMFGSGNKIATYTIMDDGTRLVYNALSESEVMNPIPLGYHAPAAGWYRFTLNERYEESGIEHLYLTDHIEGRTIDLMVRDYSFFSLMTNSDTRFTLSAVVKKPQVTTGVDGAEWEQDVSVYGGERSIVIRGVPSGADVWIFSADGKLVRRWQNTTQGRLQTNVTADGVYNVRIIKGNSAKTVSCVIR